MKISDRQIHQVVVVGAGLTGVMTALALSYCGFGSAEAPAITLIDRVNHDDASAKTTTRDHRTTTINAAGMTMLDALGVWPLIVENTTPISRIKVAYGAPRYGGLNRRQSNEFSLDWQSGETPMAYVVSNQDLLNALYERLATRPISRIHGHEVTGFDREGDYALLQFDERPDLLCQLVVACDGANSKLRNHASIRTIGEPHRQTAIIANLVCKLGHNNTAFQRFLPNGPIALMPHGANRVSLVWSLPKNEAAMISALDKNEFANMTLAAFGETLGTLKLDGPRLNWPLKPTLAAK